MFLLFWEFFPIEFLVYSSTWCRHQLNILYSSELIENLFSSTSLQVWYFTPLLVVSFHKNIYLLIFILAKGKRIYLHFYMHLRMNITYGITPQNNNASLPYRLDGISNSEFALPLVANHHRKWNWFRKCNNRVRFLAFDIDQTGLDE